MALSILSVGVRFIVHVQQNTETGVADADLSHYAGSRDLIFKKPDGSTTTVPGTLLNPPGSDGRLYCETAPGFFSASGKWQVRAHLKADSSHELYSPWRAVYVGS